MTDTPLADTLRTFAAAHPLRMHMPGHKGKFLPLAELSAAAPLDFTELPSTGDLFGTGGPIRAAEDLWAAAFRAEHCLFLTGGTTQGMLAAFALACRPGEAVLIDRGCHRCVYNALALMDLHPHYLCRPWLEEEALFGSISPQAVDKYLTCHPEIKTVCITSPTYYGICSDVPAIAAAVHAHHALLLVDGAHGAHLPFLGDWDLSAADAAAVSAHKTLPAPGQSALLFSSTFPFGEMQKAAALFGSSSPSYLMMAALDAARAWMEDEGQQALSAAAEQAAFLRRRFPALTGPGLKLDPLRLAIRCSDGFDAQEKLEALGVYPEMADRRHLVFICTAADTPEDFYRLSAALAQVLRGQPSGPLPPLPPPPEPQVVLPPRAARFAGKKSIPLARAAGEIAGEQAAPYPPGVPVLAPGERITKKTIAYLTQIGYNMEKDMDVVLF